MTDGRELALSVGDRVRVTGGPVPEGGFATSSIHRQTANGNSEPIIDRPRSGVATSPVLQEKSPIIASRPNDFNVSYASYSPPLAPPHSWERHVRIGPEPVGTVQLKADVGARNAPDWTVTFPLYEVHLDWLFNALASQHLFEMAWRVRDDLPIGAGAERLAVTANGRQITIPPFVADEQQALAAASIGAVEALVPTALLNDLETRRLAYVGNRR